MELSINEINELSAVELLEKTYGKKLESKKTVLEYIEIVKILRNPEVNPEKVQETYNLIYSSIDKMNETVKPNTIMFLMNALKAQLGKFVADKDPKKEHGFIKFFKMAYPAKMRGKGFTRVLMNINNITDEQIWTTLTYINRGYIKRELTLTAEDKVAIKDMVGKLVAKNNIKYVNQVKSMEKILSALNIKVINVDGKFKIK